MGAQIAELPAGYEGHMEAPPYRKAAVALRALWSAGNAYLDEKAPWTEVTTDLEGAALAMRTAMNLIHLCSVVSEPFISASARAKRSAFDLADDTASWVSPEQAATLAVVPAGTPFTVPAVLFPRGHRRGLGVVLRALRRQPGGPPGNELTQGQGRASTKALPAPVSQFVRIHG